MFYPLPQRTSFAAILDALYKARLNGFALVQFRNGEAIKVYKVESAVEITTPAAPAPHAQTTQAAHPEQVPTAPTVRGGD